MDMKLLGAEEFVNVSRREREWGKTTVEKERGGRTKL